MTIWEFADKHLQPYKVKNNEIIPALCPFCNGGQHHDKETFALNVQKQTYNCKRGSCGQQGHFNQLLKAFGEQPEQVYDTYRPRQYKKPTAKIEPITDQAEKYLMLRKISKKTMDVYGVGSDGKGNIMFPFYENGELVFVKYRPARKLKKGEHKAWREANTKPVLFGMDLCNVEYPLTIFEGEIDALSGYEAGIPNCVSVPSGAEDLTFIDTCYDFIKSFKTIYLFGDNDKPGQELIKKLTVKLRDQQVFIVNHECKDANELLFRKGVEAVKAAYDNAKEVPVYGLIQLADVEPFDPKNCKTSLSGIKHLDSKTGGFLMGDLSIWTGKRGEGKSTLLSQLMLDAIDTGDKVCVYSGEMRADRFQYWSNLQAAGKSHILSYYDEMKDREVYYVPKDITEKIKGWYRGKYWLYDNSIPANREESGILKVFEYAAKRYDCNVFMVDNLMTARYNKDPNNFYRAQADFVNQLVEFANRFNVHVHLVAHPRKTRGDLENDDVGGMAEITNLAHNVFALERLKEEEKAKQGVDVALKILKNRMDGASGVIGLDYDNVSRRLTPPSEPQKQYGWSDAETPEFPLEEGDDVPW